MIETDIHQKDKPDPISNDSSGTLFQEGLKVAYNKSGSVVKGTIVEIQKNYWKVARGGVGNQVWWSAVFAVKVQGIDGKFSIVRNPNSLIAV